MGPDEEQEQQSGARPWPLLDPERGQRPRVLVAEDQPEMRALLRRALKRQGYEVVEAADGPGLVKAIIDGLLADQTQVPDLIITDVRMPGYSGLEVVARLRREGWTTPVILITAFGDAQLHRDAELLGAARVLDKPFAMEDLCATAEALVPPVR
ncbi:response regulator [Myxococcus sp. CA051A]|uniref:Response regulator n=1 Tax=Myxococcus llanfairpwllgwyngyllgogerychwyrndrobwllllantysiliogogogochensis TaxID=2590453 RepID=A0A540WPM4_9BACT|nr:MULTISPECIES: response regulator [Myxococcus]NTX06217.1 response regulator [Myxococcus sp. CA040A]NTX09478.1 response regulator [Myxococcus sp. CA056]NTX34844.1 response regulator [Myxococcus sp. CA033]NTX57765.1 response regulator [Myxococcus sp. CA039A]NTX61101.1 response regulator [Myxococcus sp. CA051A]